MKFSVIIPVLNEAAIINSTIEHIYSLDKKGECEVIVVDGNPEKNTLEVIADRRVLCLASPKGRGRQMNAGARAAKGDILIFLHCDTRLPENALDKMDTVLPGERCAAGAFRLGIDSENIILKFIAWTANIRTCWTGIPYGDQAIFVKREIFSEIGGYSEIPLMEDADLIRMIRKLGEDIYIIRDKAMTSARRWEENGIIKTTLKNDLVRILFSLGVSPEALAKLYRNN